MTRATVTSWAKANVVSLVTLIGGAFLALGFVVQSPSGQLRAVRYAMDTVGHRVDGLEHRIGEVETAIGAAQLERRADNDSLFRLIRQIQAANCLVGDARDLALIGIPCSALVRTARAEAKR